jgi:hypothetical protein
MDSRAWRQICFLPSVRRSPPLHRFHIGYDANVIALLGAVVNQPGGSGLFCSLVEHNRLRATESP